MNFKNPIVGEGQYSHEVPAVQYQSVLVSDSHHQGSLVTRRHEDGRPPCFVFAGLDGGATVAQSDRVVLVKLLCEPDELSEFDAFAVDLDHGLAMIGLELGEPLERTIGTVLWDSDSAT